MNDRLVLTDDLLRRALERRMAHAASPLLLDRIVAGAGAVPQDRAPRQWRLRRRPAGTDGPARPGRRTWTFVQALATSAAAVIVAVIAVLALRPIIIGPGATPTVPSASPSPTPSAPPLPEVSPAAILLGDHAAQRLWLGGDVAPIDVTFAFGSIWIADNHANDVRRFEPATFREIARIPMPSGTGPAWFTATADELWVTNQLGSGLTRIDPATNTVVGVVGEGSTCGAPVQALGTIWQSACGADQYLRIDPVSRTVVDRFPALGHRFLALAGESFLTLDSRDGLARFDPESRSFSPIEGGPSGIGTLFGSDGETIWIQFPTSVERVDPDGTSLATFRYMATEAMTFGDGSAWLTAGPSAVEIDLSKNEELQTILVTGSPFVPLEASGALWVTDHDNHYLWRIEP